MKEPHQAPGTPPQRLAVAAAFWRMRLSAPMVTAFQTAQEFARRTIPAPSDAQLIGVPRKAFVVTQILCPMELSDVDRPALLASLRNAVDLEGVFTLKQGRRATLHLVRRLFLVSEPLTAREAEELSAHQAASLEEFERCLARTSDVLLKLTERGADPVYVLSVLIRYATRRGAEFPEGEQRRFPSADFVTVVPHARHKPPLAWTVSQKGALPLSLQAWQVVQPPVRRRRKPGPAETGLDAGMALLARHFEKVTERKHAAEIAALFEVWGAAVLRAPLTRILVYRRITRLKQRHGAELRQLVQSEAKWIQANSEALVRFTA